MQYMSSNISTDAHSDHSNHVVAYTVDLVIFASLNFREFLILGLFTKFRIREFTFFFSSVIIIIIFARFLNSRIRPAREIRDNRNLANIARFTVFNNNVL